MCCFRIHGNSLLKRHIVYSLFYTGTFSTISLILTCTKLQECKIVYAKLFLFFKFMMNWFLNILQAWGINYCKFLIKHKELISA